MDEWSQPSVLPFWLFSSIPEKKHVHIETNLKTWYVDIYTYYDHIYR